MKYFSGISFVYTSWTCVLSHDPLQGISLDEKKSVLKRSATVQKRFGLNSTFFFNRFDQFCSTHVNKWTVHVLKIFLENNRNRSEPYRTVKKKPEWIFAFRSHQSRLLLRRQRKVSALIGWSCLELHCAKFWNKDNNEKRNILFF